MSDDNKVIAFRQPDAVDDPLTAVLRADARRLLEQAIEAEVETFLCNPTPSLSITHIFVERSESAVILSVTPKIGGRRWRKNVDREEKTAGLLTS